MDNVYLYLKWGRNYTYIYLDEERGGRKLLSAAHEGKTQDAII